jgi:hypothetical protein
VSWQLLATFASSPGTVAVVVAIVSVFFGRQALEQKDTTIQAKEAALQAKDEQIETLKLLAPANVLEQVRALHDLYRDQLAVMESQRLADTGDLNVKVDRVEAKLSKLEGLMNLVAQEEAEDNLSYTARRALELYRDEDQVWAMWERRAREIHSSLPGQQPAERSEEPREPLPPHEAD